MISQYTSATAERIIMKKDLQDYYREGSRYVYFGLILRALYSSEEEFAITHSKHTSTAKSPSIFIEVSTEEKGSSISLYIRKGDTCISTTTVLFDGRNGGDIDKEIDKILSPLNTKQSNRAFGFKI